MYPLKQAAKRFVRRQEEWAIGIYSGESPFNLKPHPQANNPVLRAKHVTDANAEFVADPFMMHEDGVWYMFFEVLDRQDNLGKIAFATSQDGLNWAYQKIVLEEPFHLSYPQIFKWEGTYYMVPETYQTGSVRLYQAVEFPTQWTCASTLLCDRNYVDASIVYQNGRWWMFSSNEEGNDTLFLHSSEDLLGPWVEHPQSPIIQGDARISRPAGRVTMVDNRLFRYAQDCSESYGKQVNAFKITELTPNSYVEQPLPQNPILQPQPHTWTATGIHTVDPHRLSKNQWLACVDGKRNTLVFQLP